MKAFDHNLMTITVLDAFGCTESGARLWDMSPVVFSGRSSYKTDQNMRHDDAAEEETGHDLVPSPIILKIFSESSGCLHAARPGAARLYASGPRSGRGILSVVLAIGLWTRSDIFYRCLEL